MNRLAIILSLSILIGIGVGAITQGKTLLGITVISTSLVLYAHERQD